MAWKSPQETRTTRGKRSRKAATEKRALGSGVLALHLVFIRLEDL
jgi:hypothetical protein